MLCFFRYLYYGLSNEQFKNNLNFEKSVSQLTNAVLTHPECERNGLFKD